MRPRIFQAGHQLLWPDHEAYLLVFEEICQIIRRVSGQLETYSDICDGSGTTRLATAGFWIVTMAIGRLS